MTTKYLPNNNKLRARTPKSLQRQLNLAIYINTLPPGDESESFSKSKGHMYEFNSDIDGKSYQLSPMEFDTLVRVTETGVFDLDEVRGAPEGSVGNFIKQSIDELIPKGLLRQNPQAPTMVELSDRAKVAKYSATLVLYD